MSKYTSKRKPGSASIRRLESKLDEPLFRKSVEEFFLKHGMDLQFTPFRLLNRIYLKHKIYALAGARDEHVLDVRKRVYDYYLTRKHGPDSLPFYMSLSSFSRPPKA